MQTAVKKPEITLDADHVYRVNGVVRPGVTEILKDASLIPDFSNQDAMLRGRAVHKATELLDRGTLDLDSVRDEFMPYLLGYERALALHKLTPIPEFIEYRLFHPFCLYAGTLDRVYRTSRGDYLLADIKTGESIPDYAKEQTAAYADALRAEGCKIDGRAVLLLKPTGDFELRQLTDQKDDQIWVSALNLYFRKHG